jgi:WhiB family redox-sensing transcriptional regulator
MPMRWRDQAACLDEDPEVFFPVGTTGPAIEQTARAKAVCAGCEVRHECLAWALDMGQAHGVWGGTDENERRMMRRKPRRPPRGSEA